VVRVTSTSTSSSRIALNLYTYAMLWYGMYGLYVWYAMVCSTRCQIYSWLRNPCDAMRCGAVRYSDEILYRAMPCHAMQMPTIRPTHLRTSRQASPVFFVCVKPSGYMHSSCFGVWRMAVCLSACEMGVLVSCGVRIGIISRHYRHIINIKKIIGIKLLLVLSV